MDFVIVQKDLMFIVPDMRVPEENLPVIKHSFVNSRFFLVVVGKETVAAET